MKTELLVLGGALTFIMTIVKHTYVHLNKEHSQTLNLKVHTGFFGT